MGGRRQLLVPARWAGNALLISSREKVPGSPLWTHATHAHDVPALPPAHAPSLSAHWRRTPSRIYAAERTIPGTRSDVRFFPTCDYIITVARVGPDPAQGISFASERRTSGGAACVAAGCPLQGQLRLLTWRARAAGVSPTHSVPPPHPLLSPRTFCTASAAVSQR